MPRFIKALSCFNIFKAFGAGIKTIVPVLPLIVFILAISYVLDEGMIMHTILNSLSSALSGISPYGVILLMFVFIALLENSLLLFSLQYYSLPKNHRVI